MPRNGTPRPKKSCLGDRRLCRVTKPSLQRTAVQPENGRSQRLSATRALTLSRRTARRAIRTCVRVRAVKSCSLTWGPTGLAGADPAPPIRICAYIRNNIFLNSLASPVPFLSTARRFRVTPRTPLAGCRKRAHLSTRHCDQTSRFLLLDARFAATLRDF